VIFPQREHRDALRKKDLATAETKDAKRRRIEEGAKKREK